MKGTNFAAVLCAAFLGTGMTASLAAEPAGSKNLIVPALFETSKSSRDAAKPLAVRHPIQAGRISQTISGRFVPSAGNSWLAKGDKAWSACATTKANLVRCAPLIDSRYMDDVEVSVTPSDSGAPNLSFTTAPGTMRTSKAVALSLGTFMRRLAAAAAHLERQEVSYAPKPWEKMLTAGGAKSAVLVPAGGCGTYDDTGVYDCTGGTVENSGGEGWSGGGEEGNYPNNEAPPFDPATGEGIDPNAPVIVIVGERPAHDPVDPPVGWDRDPSLLPYPVMVPIPTDTEAVRYIPAGCMPGPRGAVFCPPAGPANPYLLPPPKAGKAWKWSWSDIEWCKVWNNCAPKTQEAEPKPENPDAPKKPAVTPDEKLAEDVAQCKFDAKETAEYCVRMRPYRQPPEQEAEQSIACAQDAIDNFKACMLTAADMYNWRRDHPTRP